MRSNDSSRHGLRATARNALRAVAREALAFPAGAVTAGSAGSDPGLAGSIVPQLGVAAAGIGAGFARFREPTVTECAQVRGLLRR